MNTPAPDATFAAGHRDGLAAPLLHPTQPIAQRPGRRSRPGEWASYLRRSTRGRRRRLGLWAVKDLLASGSRAAVPPVVELLAVMSSHTMNRPAPISAFSDQRRTKSSILIPRIVRNPDPGQSSQALFLGSTCSAINSAKTSSLVRIFFSR